MRQTTNVANTIKYLLNPSLFLGSKATKYGLDNEIIAIRDFQSKTGLAVLPSGFFICEEHPYLGATPDGLIGSDGLIEVKCPFNARTMSPLQEIETKKNDLCHY
jgi:YqaJ-like viral recombinase domain